MYMYLLLNKVFIFLFYRYKYTPENFYILYFIVFAIIICNNIINIVNIGNENELQLNYINTIIYTINQ